MLCKTMTSINNGKLEDIFEGDKGSLLHYIQWTEVYGGQKNLCDLSLSTPSVKITSKGVLTHNYIHVFDKCTISNCQICQQYKGRGHVIEVKK